MPQKAPIVSWAWSTGRGYLSLRIVRYLEAVLQNVERLAHARDGHPLKGRAIFPYPLFLSRWGSSKVVQETPTLDGSDLCVGHGSTAGGLLFIGASKDEYFRAFDKTTGEEVWKYKLPAGGYATPSTYEVDGVQYVVIACGGGKMGTKPGDSYVAFSLK